MMGLSDIRQQIGKLKSSDSNDFHKLLGALAENSTIGIYVIQDGKFQFTNSMFQKYIGYCEEELIGINSLSIVYPEDRDIVRSNAVKMLKGNSSSPYEFRYVNKSGERLWVMESVTSINYQGRQAALGSFIDTTQRKQIEERYRHLLDDTYDGYGVTQEGKIVFANRRFAEIFGYEPGQVIGKPIDNFLMPDDRQALLDQYKRVMHSEEEVPQLRELLVKKKDGSLITIQGNIKVIEYKGKPAAYTIIRDVTDRKQTEATLRKSEEKLRLIFESVPEGIIITDFDGKILDANSSAIQMYGYDTKKDLIGQKGTALITDRDHTSSINDIKKVLQGEIQGIIRSTFVKKDGNEFPVMLSTAVMRDTSDQPSGVVSIVTDITEQQKRRQQLMLTDRLASIGQLVAGVTHELNNPLTGVIGISELLLRKDIPDDIREDLEIINKEAKRAANIVKGLLTFVRNKGTEKALTDINSIIQEVLQLRSYEQKVCNIEIEARYATDLPRVIVSGTQMQQVFMNLIINAEQSILEANGKGKITINTEETGCMIRVSIHDDGPGINRENMKRLFTPFFTTKDIGKGTGLGLSICHGIITEHDGRIYTSSEPDKGATFIVELPVPGGEG